MKNLIFISLFFGLLFSGLAEAALISSQGVQELCAISGSTGNQIKCPLILASANSALQTPTALEFKISWDSSRLKIQPFEYDFCYEGICYPLPLPDCSGNSCTWNPLASGHSVAHAPLDFSAWQGQGTMIIVNTADPSIPITHAYLEQDGTLTGTDAIFLTARFELLADISPASPVQVQMSEVTFSSAEAAAMPFTFIESPIGRAYVVFLDINDNGVVELADAVLALQMLAGITPALPMKKGMDLNGDGRVGMEEAIFSLQKVANLR